MFSGCRPFFAFIRSSGQILLPQYLLNFLNNFDKTDGEYWIAPTDDVTRFWRPKVKVTAGRQGGWGIEAHLLVCKFDTFPTFVMDDPRLFVFDTWIVLDRFLNSGTFILSSVLVWSVAIHFKYGVSTELLWQVLVYSTAQCCWAFCSALIIFSLTSLSVCTMR